MKMHRKVTSLIGFLLLLLLGIFTHCVAQDITPTEIAGSSGGNSFSENMLQAGGRIAEIHVFSGDWIDAIQIWYELPDGRVVFGERYGGPNGKESSFRLDSNEYITAISGRYGDYIDSIIIQTNKRSSPLFGGRGGRRDYNIQLKPDSLAIGVAGRSGKYLDAIGLLAGPLMQRQETQIYGGNGGSAFSDKAIPAGARLTEIRIQSATFIDGIQAVYTLSDGRRFEGPRHGGTGGNPSRFKLDSDEYVIAITGKYGNYIDSLAIVTNKRTSQVFGGPGGRSTFQVEIPQGSRAIGFAGRAASYLDAIGLTYEQSLNQNPRRNIMRRLPGRNRP